MSEYLVSFSTAIRAGDTCEQKDRHGLGFTVGETDLDDPRSHFYTNVPKDGITDAMDMNLGKPQEMLRDSMPPGMLQPMGLQRVGHDWTTEQPPPPKELVNVSHYTTREPQIPF